MSIPTELQGTTHENVRGKGGDVASVNVSRHAGLPVGLVAFTAPLQTFENQGGFFVNPEEGIDMNIDASTGGTPDNIHNGGDAVYWTGSNVVGAAGDFANTAQFNTGAASVRFWQPALNDVIQFAKGSDVTMSTYKAITMFIRVDSRWIDDSISFYAWDTAANAQVGDAVLLENYIVQSSNDVWQKVTIQVADLGDAATSTVVDAFRIELVALDATSPRLWIDDIALQETGGGTSYLIKATKGDWLHVDTIRFFYARAGASTLTGATMPNLDYSTILGYSFIDGLRYQWKEHNEVKFDFPITALGDHAQFVDVDVNAGSDGTNTWLTVQHNFNVPIVLKSEDDDHIRITVAEDLTSFLRLRVTYNAKNETRHSTR